MDRNRIVRWIAGLGAAALLAGCAPSITVQNNTAFPVRALITAGGMRQMVFTSPGQASYPEVQTGPFTATVIPDSEWLEHARATRAYLNSQLANADSLTGEQLLEVIRRLKDIAARIDQFERAAAGRSASAINCTGTVSDEQEGVVVIKTDAGGQIVLDCG